jgi:hypothetical protein
VVGERAAFTARAQGLKVGVEAVGNFDEMNFIYRIKNSPQLPVKYDYLIVSENISSLPHIDILSIKDFHRLKEKLRTSRSKNAIGIEITIESARSMDAKGAARWMVDAYELYSFCHSFGFQFILSSGATNPEGTVSGRSFDAILKTIGIEPQKYWHGLDNWLKLRSERRVHIS